MESMIIEMPKRMDANAVSGMRKRTTLAFESESELVIFDFKHCDFMDSLGLSIIVTAIKMSAKANKKLRLVHVGPQVKLLLQITRFDRICDIYESLESATT